MALQGCLKIEHAIYRLPSRLKMTKFVYVGWGFC